SRISPRRPTGGDRWRSRDSSARGRFRGTAARARRSRSTGGQSAKRARMDAADRVTQTVILAAGLGGRLAGSDASVPKPLITVAGLPLIAHALAHAAASGCDDAIIVIGNEGRRVRAAVEALVATAAMAGRIAVRFVENPDPTTPNGHSLLIAEPCAHDRFFLQMV